MEAVRQLLFGKRVTEIQAHVSSLAAGFDSALKQLETLCLQRIGALEKAVTSLHEGLVQRTEEAEIVRQQELQSLQQSTDSRFVRNEKFVESLGREIAGQQAAIRSEFKNLHKELLAETYHIRQTTPTLTGLADLFQQTSQRLQMDLGPDREIAGKRHPQPVRSEGLPA